MEKRKVDLIIKHGLILTVNDENDIIKDGGVAIQGTDIVALGPVAEILAAYEAAEVIDATDQIVMPGLIDTHIHTAQQFERNLLSYLKKETNLRDPVWQFALIPLKPP